MIIVRDGKEFELTPEELRRAFWEQNRLYDIEDIKTNMEEHMDEDDYELLKDNKAFILFVADELRKGQENYDFGFTMALSEAFRNGLKTFLPEKYK